MRAQEKIAAQELRRAKAVERVKTARARLAKLKWGEAVEGGLEKRIDLAAALKAAGYSAKDVKRLMLLAQLPEAELESTELNANHAK